MLTEIGCRSRMYITFCGYKKEFDMRNEADGGPIRVLMITIDNHHCCKLVVG